MPAPRVPLLAALLYSAILMFPAPAPAASGPLPKHLVFKDEAFDYELRRNVGYAVTGGADINECFHAANQIMDRDFESWFRAWNGLAGQVRGLAYQSLQRGHNVSAREALLRASNYYRTAAFFLHGNPSDPRIRQTWRLSRESFRQAARLLDHPVEIVRMPYEQTTLPGYFLKPDNSPRPRKTLLLQTGFDGTGEELYFVAVFALRRDWNVLIFEGPGQGGALIQQGLHFRPDWEKVVTPVMDFALSRPDVDANKVALMGLSMGGFLAPRAAAFEHRLAACVANPGQFDLYGAQNPSPGEWREMNEYPEQTNQQLRRKMAEDVGFRWWIENGMFTSGAKTPLEFMRFWGEFTLKDDVLNIRCPTLVVASNGDHFLTLQDSLVLYDKLVCPKTLLRFLGLYQANQHCQVGALSTGMVRIMDWLDDLMAGKSGKH